MIVGYMVEFGLHWFQSSSSIYWSWGVPQHWGYGSRFFPTSGKKERFHLVTFCGSCIRTIYRRLIAHLWISQWPTFLTERVIKWQHLWSVSVALRKGFSSALLVTAAVYKSASISCWIAGKAHTFVLKCELVGLVITSLHWRYVQQKSSFFLSIIVGQYSHHKMKL